MNFKSKIILNAFMPSKSALQKLHLLFHPFIFPSNHSKSKWFEIREHAKLNLEKLYGGKYVYTRLWNEEQAQMGKNYHYLCSLTFNQSDQNIFIFIFWRKCHRAFVKIFF